MVQIKYPQPNWKELEAKAREYYGIRMETGGAITSNGDTRTDRQVQLVNEIIENSLDYINSLSSRFTRRVRPDLEPEVLNNAYVTGLIKSMGSFDPNKHNFRYWMGLNHFTSCRRLDHLEQPGIISVPYRLHSLGVRHKIKELSDTGLSQSEVITELLKDEKFIIENYSFLGTIEQQRRKLPLIHQAVTGDYEPIHSDGIVDAEQKSPSETASKNQLGERLNAVLDLLGERNARVIRRRFGLREFEFPSTLEEVAESEGVTRERIRQIEIWALKKLGQPPKREIVKQLYEESTIRS